MKHTSIFLTPMNKYGRVRGLQGIHMFMLQAMSMNVDVEGWGGRWLLTLNTFGNHIDFYALSSDDRLNL